MKTVINYQSKKQGGNTGFVTIGLHKEKFIVNDFFLFKIIAAEKIKRKMMQILGEA